MNTTPKNTTRGFRSLMVASALIVIAGAITTAAWATDRERGDTDEQVIATSELPEVVRNAMIQHAGTNGFDRVVKKEEEEAVVYEAAWKRDGQTHEATLTSAGDLMETEVAIPRGATPKSIQAVADKTMPNTSNIVYEKKTIVLYSIEANIDGETTEMLLLPTGQRVRDIEVVDDDNERGQDDKD